MAKLLRQPLKLALIQLATGADKTANLARARSKVLEATSKVRSLSFCQNASTLHMAQSTFQSTLKHYFHHHHHKSKVHHFMLFQHLQRKPKSTLLVEAYQNIGKKRKNTTTQA
ncbi:hypothetical protein MRB53_039750 [Persea americana]|nr:hypothetical protein MRB53_039750 [Persea americana]